MPERFSALRGRRVGVWGLGRETRALCNELRGAFDQCVEVVATDTPSITEGYLAHRQVSGGAVLSALMTCDVVVRSPGVSIHRAEVRTLRAAGIAVVTSTGLWLAEARQAPAIGVTGTKGKSTTAALTAHLLREAGLSVELAGNIGRPAIELLSAPTADCYVLELSSYQIADLEVGVDIAVYTNLYPEHIDWHGSHEQYFADKLRLAGLPSLRATVLNTCDSGLAKFARGSVRQLEYGCSGRFTIAHGAVLDEGKPLTFAPPAALRGEHNLLNLCGALTAASEVANVVVHLDNALTFAPLPHRLQSLGVLQSVEWIDDSISTTPESTIAAIASLPNQPLVLIGGGYDRQQDYRALASELAVRDVDVIGLPATGTRLLGDARAAGVAYDRLFDADDLVQAVELARQRARPGAAVLLSPAAASFGQFTSFEQRGRRFGRLAGFG